VDDRDRDRSVERGDRERAAKLRDAGAPARSSGAGQPTGTLAGALLLPLLLLLPTTAAFCSLAALPSGVVSVSVAPGCAV
jgi:hypothetical protein